MPFRAARNSWRFALKSQSSNTEAKMYCGYPEPMIMSNVNIDSGRLTVLAIWVTILATEPGNCLFSAVVFVQELGV